MKQLKAKKNFNCNNCEVKVGSVLSVDQLVQIGDEFQEKLVKEGFLEECPLDHDHSEDVQGLGKPDDPVPGYFKEEAKAPPAKSKKKEK